MATAALVVDRNQRDFPSWKQVNRCVNNSVGISIPLTTLLSAMHLMVETLRCSKRSCHRINGLSSGLSVNIDRPSSTTNVSEDCSH
uniref:Uncharacterized protein n=1 Tax=Hyaloperonospora arabidopsidis (strain Emoy2) TaxID=559515 RepID=M4BCC4_HYAAE